MSSVADRAIALDGRSSLLALGGWRAALPWVVLVAGPVAVQWPEFVGWLTANPIYFVSGLTGAWPDSPITAYPWIDGNAGATVQALGRLVVKDWLGGAIPWWNPYSGVGLPLAAEMQPGAFFLPFVFLLALFNGVLYLKIVMQIVAGAATYALLRELRIGRSVALVGALLFEFNGTFAWFSDAPIMPIAFLPLLLLGIERCRRLAEQRRSGGWLTVAISIAYSIVACFPETAYVDGLLALVWAAVRLGETGQRAAFTRKVAGGGLLGVMLAAPAILPFVEYLGQTDLGAHALVGHLGFRPEHFAMLLFPYVYGPIFFDSRYALWGTFVGGYCGLGVVLLAGFAPVSGRTERRLRWALAAWIALAVAKAANAPGVAFLFNQLPLVRLIEFFRYAQPSWELAAIVLAALAIEDRRKGEAPGPAAVLAVSVATFALAIVALLAGRNTIAGLWPVAGYKPFLWASLAGGFGVAAAIAALFIRRSAPATNRALYALVCTEALLLFSLPIFSGTRDVRLDLPAIAFLRQNLGLARFYTIGALGPNYGAFFRIASINHNAMPVPRRWIDYIRRHLDPDAAGTTFNGTYPPPDAAWAAETRPEALRRRLAAYAGIGVKYVLTPPGADPFVAPNGGGSAVAHPIPVYRDPVMTIYELPEVAPYFEAPGGACELTPAGRLVVRARCSRPGTLVRRELYYPGWRASVNRRDVPLRLHDTLFQELPLPAGESLVRFRYRPPGFGFALAAFSLALAVATTGFGTSLRRKRTR